MIFLLGCLTFPVCVGSATASPSISKAQQKGLFKNPVVLTRWGLFFKSYKEKRYYWELVITLRKVSWSRSPYSVESLVCRDSHWW